MTFGGAPKSSVWASSALMLVTTAALMAVVMTAPANSNSDDQLGSSVSRVYYRNGESIPSSEDNVIPISLDAGQQIPNLYEPHMINIPPPSENAILNLLARRLMGNSRFRSYLNGIDASNEISRKRSYSKYCAFNAVSCFGK